MKLKKSVIDLLNELKLLKIALIDSKHSHILFNIVITFFYLRLIII